MAAVRAPAAAGIPAHAAPPAQDVGFLRRSSETISVVSWTEWIRDVEVEPSLYAADFSRLGEQVEALLGAGTRIFHFDVGDGHFIPPITTGPIVLEWIAPLVHDAGAVLDCHLMV